MLALLALTMLEVVATAATGVAEATPVLETEIKKEIETEIEEEVGKVNKDRGGTHLQGGQNVNVQGPVPAQDLSTIRGHPIPIPIPHVSQRTSLLLLNQYQYQYQQLLFLLLFLSQYVQTPVTVKITLPISSLMGRLGLLTELMEQTQTNLMNLR